MQALLKNIKNNFTYKYPLKIRMQDLIKKFNDNKFDIYKPYIISLKSKEILEYLNYNSSSIEDKINQWKNYNNILLNVTQLCYNRFNPSMIYTFNDEIHMVFYDTLDYPDLYNRNINKNLTIITSFVTHHFTKEFIRCNLDFEFTISSKYIEFSLEYETLNYLVWRQLDCKRNNIITLIKYFNNNIKSVNLTDITQELFHNLHDLNITFTDLEFLIHGNILKKELIDNDIITSQCYTNKSRKRIKISHNLLYKNFKENLDKYILNKYL